MERIKPHSKLQGKEKLIAGFKRKLIYIFEYIWIHLRVYVTNTQAKSGKLSLSIGGMSFSDF